ncbi:response regulator [Desulfuromonas carbonis]
MSLHIVVIDDCPVTLEMVKDYLAAAGFRVSTCDCAVYSNHLIYAKQPPDLILLDVMLPLMSGTKKAKALKSRERSRDIPILLMSSKEEIELRTLTAMSGADGYLPKPFSATSLVRTIRSLLPA